MIDRDFRRAAICAATGAGLSLFGIIHSVEIGFLTAAGDQGWRFAVAYASAAVVFAVLAFGQDKGFVDAAIDDSGEDQRSVVSNDEALAAAVAADRHRLRLSDRDRT